MVTMVRNARFLLLYFVTIFVTIRCDYESLNDIDIRELIKKVVAEERQKNIDRNER